MKGSRTVSTVLVLVAALLGASLVATLFIDSPLRQVIDQGAGNLAEKTDYTITIGSDKNDKEAKEQFSDLAMLVYQRAEANGCGEGGLVERQKNGNVDPKAMEDGAANPRGRNDPQGYPGLAHTYLGQNPPCYGAEGSPLRAGDGGGAGVANDMEGIYSREYFEIQEDFVLYGGGKPGGDDDRPRAETWLEQNLLAPAYGSREDFIGECNDGKQFGTGRQYMAFYPGGVSTSRGGPTMDNFYSGSSSVYEAIYCGVNLADSSKIHTYYGERNAVRGDKKVYMTFCKGDKGYMFVPKGTPQNDGEANARAASTVIAGETLSFQNNAKFPAIVITEKGSSDCLQGDIGIEDVEYNVLNDDPSQVEIEVTVDNNGRKFYDGATFEVVGGDGSTLKTKDVNIGPGENRLTAQGARTSGSGGFAPELCRVDISINHDSLSTTLSNTNVMPTHRKGEEFDPLTTDDSDFSSCLNSAEQYSFKVGSPEAEKQSDLWGAAGSSLEITVPIENVGTQRNTVLLRADFTQGSGQQDGNQRTLEVSDEKDLSVTKGKFQEVDRCTVPVNILYYHQGEEEWKKYEWGGTLYNPTASTDTLEVDISHLMGAYCDSSAEAEGSLTVNNIRDRSSNRIGYEATIENTGSYSTLYRVKDGGDVIFSGGADTDGLEIEGGSSAQVDLTTYDGCADRLDLEAVPSAGPNEFEQVDSVNIDTGSYPCDQ